MIGYFVIILLAAGSVLAAALFFRHRQKQVMDGLSDMLEAAINGTFSETTFDESRQSSLENRLAQYLAASELSVRSIDAEREKIKELIADISHQTRTPLSNILLYTRIGTGNTRGSKCSVTSNVSATIRRNEQKVI